MIEWLKQLPAKIKELWAKWKPVQKGIFIGIVLLCVVALVLMFRVNSAPAGVPLFTTVIRDEDAREKITLRLDEENVSFRVRDDGLIIVNDSKTAEKMKSLLITEGLVPSEVDAFSLFDKSSWSDTDFDRNIKLRRSLEKQLKQHILALVVTVINECCGKPGEVTQEQIDGACTGTVACPHCGRWSSFSIVEPKQAEEQGMEMI